MEGLEGMELVTIDRTDWFHAASLLSRVLIQATESTCVLILREQPKPLASIRSRAWFDEIRPEPTSASLQAQW